MNQLLINIIIIITFLVKLGKKHPDPVVETASLSSVEPADVKYELSIPMETINSGSLSALQLEAITYTCQQHEHILPDGSRAGFLIGDGAGVGKGRTIAGLIFENFVKGRKKAIWVSVSNDLKFDAERDLSDIGTTNIKVYSLNKVLLLFFLIILELKSCFDICCSLNMPKLIVQQMVMYLKELYFLLIRLSLVNQVVEENTKVA